MNTKELRVVLLNRIRVLLAKEMEIRLFAREHHAHGLTSKFRVDGSTLLNLNSGWCEYLLDNLKQQEHFSTKLELRDRHIALGWNMVFPVKYGDNTESINGDMYFSATPKQMWGEGDYADQRWKQLARLEAHLSKLTEN